MKLLLSECESLSCVQPFFNPVDCSQAPLSMAFPRQDSSSGLPFFPPGDLPDPGTEPRSPVLQTDIFFHLSHQGSPFQNFTHLTGPLSSLSFLSS